MEWVTVVLMCITNAPEINWKAPVKGCIMEYARCIASPGRKDTPCSLKFDQYYEKSKEK